MINNSSTSILTIILYIMLAIMFALLVALIFVFLNTKIKEKQQEEKNIKDDGNKPVSKEKTKTFTVNSIFDFMEFDKIEDNMIIQKNGMRYVMVFECQGINYDLMSQA